MSEESSFLSSIIKDNTQNTPEISPIEGANNPQANTPTTNETTMGSPNTPKKPREPLPPGTILKAIGALLFTAIIFFASFLAYIVFNPNEAQFFITMFNIDTKDVATILRKFINASFGIILLTLSIAWIITLFRAFWTPREQKRKKTLASMIAILIGLLLFSILAFWGFLFKKIGEIVWDGGIINIYDNALYDDPDGNSISMIRSTQNLIGPINLRYDIRGNAKSLEANGIMKINRYEMNFDGAKCSDGMSIVKGDDPKNEQGIICTFDINKTYNIRGSYFGTDVNGEIKEVPMELSNVKIGGLVEIREQKNINDKDIVTLDASGLKLMGDPIWTHKGGNQEKKNSITIEPSETPVFVQLSVGAMTDRVFLVKKNTPTRNNGVIEVFQSPENPLKYTFTLTGSSFDANTLLKIDWTNAQGSIVCAGAKMICETTFNNYGSEEIKANITLTDQSNIVVSQSFWIDEPIKLVRHVVVTDSDNKVVNESETYDTVRGVFAIDNMSPPNTITLDAQDIVPENAGYTLKEVRWQFSDGKTISEKIGNKISFDLINNYRYTIVGKYTFEKRAPGGTIDTKIARDTVIIDVSRQSLIPKFSIIKASDYVPVSITVDGSQSWSEKNDIVKFIYDFGEGKPEAIGDAIQTYQYSTSGNKEISLTIIDSTGQKSTIKKTLVLKDAPRTVSFVPSLATGIVGIPIDFTIQNDVGQVDTYTWSFADNTGLQHGPTVTHTFQKAGTYTVVLTITYTDGTQKQSNLSYTVNASE